MAAPSGVFLVVAIVLALLKFRFGLAGTWLHRPIQWAGHPFDLRIFGPGLAPRGPLPLAYARDGAASALCQLRADPKFDHVLGRPGPW
jgi:hypothetical protein